MRMRLNTQKRSRAQKAPDGYRVGEVLKLSGLTEWQFGRGKRYGIIGRPTGSKRGARYTDAHLEAARWLRSQLDLGRSYDEIAKELKSGKTIRLGPARPDRIRQAFHLPNDIIVQIPLAGPWQDFRSRETLANALLETCRAVAQKIQGNSEG